MLKGDLAVTKQLNFNQEANFNNGMVKFYVIAIEALWITLK